MQGIDIAKAPVRLQPVIKAADTKPQDGFISGTEAIPAATEISKFLGADTTLFKDNDKAMEYLMKVMGVEFVKMPEAEPKVISAPENSKINTSLSKDEIAKAIEMVSNDIYAIRNFSPELRNNKEVVMLAVKRDGWALGQASKLLKNDREVVLAALAKNENVFECVGDELRNDKELVLEAVKENGAVLKFVNEELRNNKEVVIAAVSGKSELFGHEVLQYASKDLRNDKEVVMVALNHDAKSFRYASEELRNDKEVVMAAVKQYGHALQSASEALKNNKEVVIAAVKETGYALEYASKELKNDKEVVIAAVKETGYALKYASKELKNDKEVVIAAVKETGNALKSASQEHQDDDFLKALALISSGTHTLLDFSLELRNNKEIVMAAVKKNVWELEYASEELRNDKEVVLAAVKQEALVLEYASEALRNNKEVVLAAVKKCHWALEYASEELKNDKEILALAESGKLSGYKLNYEIVELRKGSYGSDYDYSIGEYTLSCGVRSSRGWGVHDVIFDVYKREKEFAHDKVYDLCLALVDKSGDTMYLFTEGIGSGAKNGDGLRIFSFPDAKEVTIDIFLKESKCKEPLCLGEVLVSAAKMGDIEAVKKILQAGVDEKSKNNALGRASFYGTVELVKILVEAGADVNYEYNLGFSPIYNAVYHNRAEVVKVLLEAGVSKKLIDKNFGDAVEKGNLEITKMMIGVGADSNAKESIYGSVLCRASSDGNTEIVKMLLEKGANVNFKGSYGTALDLAVEKKYVEVVELLKKYGAK